MKKLLLLSLAGLGLLTFASCGDAKHVEVAKNFATALSQENYDEAMKYADERTNGLLTFAKSLGERGEEADSMPAEVDIQILSEELRGDSAIVSVVDRKAAEPDTLELTLVKVNDEWKVSLVPEK